MQMGIVFTTSAHVSQDIAATISLFTNKFSIIVKVRLAFQFIRQFCGDEFYCG